MTRKDATERSTFGLLCIVMVLVQMVAKAGYLPWYSKAPRILCRTAFLISAEEWTRWKFLPPIHVQNLLCIHVQRRTGLANNPRVALVHIEIGSDVLPQLLEHERAPGEVQRGEVRV